MSKKSDVAWSGSKTEDAKHFSYRWVWLLVSIVILALVAGGLRWSGVWLDHKVLVNSHSYQMAGKSSMSTYQAEIDTLVLQIEATTDPEHRKVLTLQLNMAKVQLRAQQNMNQ